MDQDVAAAVSPAFDYADLKTRAVKKVGTFGFKQHIGSQRRASLISPPRTRRRSARVSLFDTVRDTLKLANTKPDETGSEVANEDSQSGNDAGRSSFFGRRSSVLRRFSLRASGTSGGTALSTLRGSLRRDRNRGAEGFGEPHLNETNAVPSGDRAGDGGSGDAGSSVATATATTTDDMKAESLRELGRCSRAHAERASAKSGGGKATNGRQGLGATQAMPGVKARSAPRVQRKPVLACAVPDRVASAPRVAPKVSPGACPTHAGCRAARPNEKPWAMPHPGLQSTEHASCRGIEPPGAAGRCLRPI